MTASENVETPETLSSSRNKAIPLTSSGCCGETTLIPTLTVV